TAPALPAPPPPGQPPPPGAPVITQAYASPQLRPGETWRVYLVANDVQGEMMNIVSRVDQPGVGTYQVSITRIEPEMAKELNGFLYLATSAAARLHNVSLTLTVQIHDRQGRYSAPAVFNLVLNDTYQQEAPPPGVFREVDLGPIMIPVHGLRERGMGPSLFSPGMR
ncbi:MAG TPA: hypothetical protein VLS90_07055, partial [Thermodesulfobacteriota bacterium]|nr:hypothetical protein [Thermodesulfobacteriota bacterium]